MELPLLEVILIANEIHYMEKKVPNTHVCVMLTTAKPNIKAPFIAGDIEENSFLEKGKFFALPKTLVVCAIL